MECPTFLLLGELKLPLPPPPPIGSFQRGKSLRLTIAFFLGTKVSRLSAGCNIAAIQESLQQNAKFANRCKLDRKPHSNESSCSQSSPV